MASTSSPTLPNSPRAEDYWQAAFNRLDDGLKAILSSVNTRKLHIVSAVVRAAEDKRQACIRKQWKYTSPRGEVIVVRDVLEKMVAWIDRFKAVGDVASQFDPVNAALP